MFDTYVTIVGNVLHEPEQRQTSNTGAVVTTFKIASTARRLDRQSGKWVDGNSVRVRVTCWRALAANVKQSVNVGDPLVVHGRLFTRDWEDEHGNRRLAYELEAVAVGHDLSRGRAVFERAKPRTSTSAIEDEQSEVRVGGELTEPVAHDRAVQFDDTPFGVVFDQPAAASLDDRVPPAGGEVGDSFGDEPAHPAGAEPEVHPSGGPVTPVGGEPDDETTPIGEPGTGRRRGVRRTKVPA